MRERQLPARFEVVVVGGGLAGLTAALELARRGRSVVVFEKAKQFGGRALTQEERGYLWNLGPHALYRRGEAKRILRELGVSFSGGVPSASGQFAVDGGRPHALPSGLVSLLSTSLLPLGAKLEFARLLVGIARIDPEELRSVTVTAWLGRMKHEGVRGLLAALVRLSTYCNAPDQMSAGDAVEQLQLAVAGSVLYLNGGWQTLVDGLRQAAADAGAELEQSVAVRALEHDGRAAGVRLADGTRIGADAVIAAVPPQAAGALFEGAVPHALGRAIDGLVPVRAACLDLALSELPARATFALGIDQPLYLSVHSAVASLAPSGGAVVHVAKYLAPDDAQQPAAVEHELEALMDIVQPGWRSHVVERRFLPAMVVSHALPAAATGGKAGRPNVNSTGVEGLFIAGDWVGGAGLLADAAVASARAAAERCHGYLGVRAAKAA